MEQTSFAHGSFTAILDEVLIFNHLRANEAFFKVSVDDTRALRSLPTAFVGPSTHLDFASSDVSFEVKHLVSRLDETIHTTFFQTHIFEKFLAFLIRFEFGNVSFRLSRHYEDFCALVFHHFAHTFHIFVARGRRVLVHVAHIKHRFRSEQEKIARSHLFVFRVKLHATCIFALEQSFFNGRKHLVFHLCVFVASHLSNFFDTFDTVLHRFQIFQLEFGINDFLVAHRVNAAVHMHHVAIVEAAQHVNDGISFADVAQELVAQSFAFGSTFHQASDVHNLHCGRNDFSGFHQFSQFRQTFVRHSDDAHVGFDGAKREVSTLCFGIAQAIKKSRLAHVGKSYDAAL